jgi:class 3 adenylate cyclase/tetratricopeptide (TPR) repeat protein
MTFEEILDHAIAMLQRRGRLTYGTLKRQFQLDDAALEDLKNELIKGQRLAVDEDGDVLVWTGGAASGEAPVFEPARQQGQSPLSYTPPHLAEKILTTRSALEGERKQVTVFFCDLANSTALAERLGPEAMHTLLNQFFALALGEVHRYEGTVNQFLGDGFMALFGAPIAHEDHARRAVLTAVGLRQRLHAGPTPLGQQYGVEVAVRMGLHTGLVIVGAIGDNLRMDYTAIGDTTNVAARLQQAAIPGQILISETTHRLVAGYCTTRSLGGLALKGKAESIHAWEVLAVDETRTRLEVAAERGLTPFTGRERELRLLHECFAQAQAGHGQVVFLVGEAGLGKSRLLLEFRQRLGTEATWLEGHAMSFGRTFAFHPMIDLLRRNFRIEEGDTEDAMVEKIEHGVLRLGVELCPILPYLRYLLAVDPGEAAVRTMDPQLRRAEIFGALRHLLLRAAEVRPQVVVFEDLHWMDKATEAFLTLTADSIPTSRVLCLLTYRPGYVHPFGERTYHTRLVLPTLSSADTVQMAQAMLDTQHLPEALQALLIQKAEGNPFFVEEVVKSLRETGAIRREGDHYILTRLLDETVVPDTIQDVLMARIDRLEEAPKKTLQLAAVIGREFTYRLLDRLADIRERTEAYLQELQALELIYERRLFPELAYMFKHALTQDVAYNSLLIQRRQELHRLIGQALEELYADRLAEQYEVLAYHFARGEEWAKALAYFCQAAEKAAQAFANREAVALYEQALEAADHLGAAVEPETLMTIYQAKANLYFVLSDFARARAEGERLLALARRTGDRVREGMALASMSHASLYAYNFDQALVVACQAIEVAEEGDVKPILAAGHYVTGRVYGVTGRLAQAKAEYDQALAFSRLGGDVMHQSLTLCYTGFFKNWEGEFAEAVRLQSEGLAIARAHTLVVPLLTGLFTCGVGLTGQGDYDEALARFAEGLVLSEKVGAEIYRHRLLNGRGWLAIECGDLDSAIEYNQQSAEGGLQRGDPETIANAELNLSDAFIAKGDLGPAQEVLDRVSRLVHDPTTADWMKWRYSMHLFASLGDLWLARGEPARAQAFTDQCLDIATRTNSRKYLVKGWRLRGEIALACRQRDEAVGWLQQALTLAQIIGNPTQLWKTHLALGHLHAAARQPEQARQAYRAARAVIERVKAHLRNSELRAGLENSSLIQHVYDLSASDYTSIG